MRRFFSDVIGNRRLCQSLADDILNHRLTHALILEGACGSGKHMIASRIAASLACERQSDKETPLPCLACNSCKKILSKGSPDVIYINKRDKATLGVEAMRGLKSDVHIAPNDIAYKIYIIEDAHLLTVQAQNALLLTLEEPPAYVLFLLLCESTASLLETIKSRAQIRRIEPIEISQMREHLLSDVPAAQRLFSEDPSAFFEILAAANGSIGRAVSLLDPKLLRPIAEKRRIAREFLGLFSDAHNSAAVLRHLSSLPVKREELIEQLGELLLALRDLLLLKQTEHAPLCFFSNAEEAGNYAYRFTTPNLLCLLESVTRAIDKLRQNANTRLALSAFAVDCGLLQ